MAKPDHHRDAAALADAIVERVGPDVVLALPLGLGKANHIANALFDRAAADPSVSLTVLTALTLEKPAGKSELERRFIGPLAERLFEGYPQLKYAQALHEEALPANVKVHEFFFQAGRWLGVARAQQDYICANYTHAGRYILDRGVNVVGQLVARQGERYSTSCNPDLTLDLLQARGDGQADFVFAGQVNDELPFMAGDADVGEDALDYVLEGPDCQFPLVGPPKPPVGLADYAAALHIARVVRDGGTLQIGIGSIADAVAHALIVRHRHNDDFRRLIGGLPAGDPCACEVTPFETGLFGASEMLSDGFLRLVDAGVIKREVDGALVQAAFFLGPRDFYARLREMPEEARGKLAMTSVCRTNEIYGLSGDERRARWNARFINKSMMVTLLGAVVSDGLEDGRVVSGVGGQYNFAAQAFALPGARSVITLDAVRETPQGAKTNIRWNYGHVTVPRHLRDIVVSEYGVADLRGKTDAQAIAAMLGIADSRFQDELLEEAKSAGKIAADYEIPSKFRDNTPERIEAVLGPARADGLLPVFPFGSDFTETEQRLMPALKRIEAASGSKAALARLAARGFAMRDDPPEVRDALERMGLDRPKSLKDRGYRALLRAALREDRE